MTQAMSTKISEEIERYIKLLHHELGVKSFYCPECRRMDALNLLHWDSEGKARCPQCGYVHVQFEIITVDEMIKSGNY